MIECTFCHAAIPDDSKFCPSCGKKPQSESPPTCARCGKTVNPGQKFCAACGAPVAPIAAPIPTPQIGYSSQPAAPAQSPAFAAPGPAVIHEQPRKKGIAPILFWIPFGALLIVSTLLFWFGKTSIVGWAILVVCFVLLLLVRPRLLTTGAVVNVVGWVVVAVVVFFTLGATATSTNDVSVTAQAGKSGQAAPDANASKIILPSQTGPASTPSVVPAAATSAPRVAGPTPTVTRAATPTPVNIKMAPPDILKPVIFSGVKPADQLKYEVWLNGERSYSWLSYQVSGEPVQLPNLYGDAYWSVIINFYLSEDAAKSGLQYYLKSARDNEKGMDQNLALAYSPIAESAVGKGDESYLLSRSNKDEPRYQMKVIVLRQGATWFAIRAQENTEKPVIPGDGIDTLLAELKKIDNKSLIASASSGNPASAPAPAPTKPNPTATPVPSKPSPTAATSSASAMKLQNLAVGLGLDRSQKVQNPTNVFKPDTPGIFLSVEIGNVKGKTDVNIQWIYLATNDSVDGPTQTIDDDARVGFSLSKPTNGWPAGQYKAVIFLNGKEAGNIGFSVQP